MSIFVVFVQNITLLISSVVIYTLIIRRWEKGTVSYSLYSGALFGIAAVFAMMTPFALEPGIIFDSRSVILSIAGLFGGPLTASAAAAIAGLYRFYLGGAGVYVGIATILQSSFFGVCFFYLRQRKKQAISSGNLLSLSLIVHLVMLALFLFIPDMSLQFIISQLAPPILLLYPVATLVIAYLIIYQETSFTYEKALEKSEKLLSKTQQMARLGSWELDHVTKKLSWSAEVYRICGLSPERYRPAYESFLDIVHPEDKIAVDTAFQRSLLDNVNNMEIEHRIIQQDTGEICFIHQKFEHIKNKAGEIVHTVGMVQDITERKLYEGKLKHISQHDCLTGLFNRNYFEEALKNLNSVTEYPVVVISADLDGLKLINDSVGHDVGDKMLVASAEVIKSSLRQTDILARVGGDEFAALLPHADANVGELICSRIRYAVSRYNQNGGNMPLSLSLGLATAAFPGDGMPGELLKKADDSMYRDKLSHSNSRSNQIIQSLMAALTERDFIAEGHADRVKNLCLMIGEKVGLTSRQLSDIALLAQVHDLGKVGIPDSILFKPNKLSQEEWDIMRLHPEKGYRIASSSADLAGVAELILKHHEHWDGNGYPKGLKEEEIPIECRILSIVDAYDAMTNDRPYSKGKTRAEALLEMERCAGSQFDPYLVKVFISIVTEGYFPP